MDPERWQRLQDLFMTARGADDATRERVLEAHARVDPELAAHARALLQADAEPGLMDAPALDLPSVSTMLQEDVAADRGEPRDGRSDHPDRIGVYRIAGELGRGGMGVVYLGTRADGAFDQRVAIKLIATSDARDPLHRRFLAERQILAGLTHPHIARLLDGGITPDGHPYLVMEQVDGLPITTFCDRHRLDVHARLRLFVDVCAAVQHAHQNLVIHRDLKPSNILVSADGRAHLLDFGIAKLIDPAPDTSTTAPQTRNDARMMTPKYASPEQVRGGTITTASDVYSLGVLLYELLCGHPPYRLTTGSPHDLATAVCEQDPERPSARVREKARAPAAPSASAAASDAASASDADAPDADADAAAQRRATTPDRLARLLDGDLDGIVLMALRKEPEARYASADMLRQDIERHLARLPVLAHRGSRRYRLRKFLRRHRVEAIAAGLVLAALLTGLSAAVYHERRATRERDRAALALAESTGVTRFLLDLFQTGDPDDAPPAQISAFELLQRGARRANQLSGQPIVQARLLDVIGQMSLNLGRLDDAERQFDQAIAIRRALPGDASLDLASSLIHLARVHRTRNDFERARPLVIEALSIRQRALPPDHADIADALYELGWLTFGPAQERLYRDAIAMLARSDTSGNAASAERRVTLLQALTTNLRRQGRLDEAVAADREGLLVAERWLGPEHHATGYAMIHLADQIADIEQDLDAAEALYRRGLDVMTRHLGEDSLRLLHGLNSLATLLARNGDNGAEQLRRRALAISRSATGDEHPRVTDQVHRLAAEIARQGRLAESETLAREALDLSTRLLGSNHQTVSSKRLPLLALVLDLQQRHEEADRTYQRAFAQISPQGVITGEMHRDYGLMLLRRRDHVRAERELLLSLTLLEQAYGRAAHPNVHETKRGLMALYRQWGKPDAIERYRVPADRFIPY